MVFGNKSDFAIEAIIEPDLEVPSHLLGRLCIWIEGKCIGDIENGYCSLFLCYKNFQKKCEELDDLWLDKFKDLSNVDIWNFLDGLLYGYHGNIELDDKKPYTQILQDLNVYSKFNFLTNWGEMFDIDGKSFILKLPTSKIKILNYDYEKEIVNCYFCTEFAFRNAIKEFSSWYSNQLNGLNSKDA